MEKLNQQHLLDLNKSLRSIQDSFDDALGRIGDKKEALVYVQDKYWDGQLFQSDVLTVNIREFSLNPNGSLYINLDFNIVFPKKISLLRWDEFSTNYYSTDFRNFDREINIKLNQLELEKIIAYRNQIAKDYLLFSKNEYNFNYHGNQVDKKFVKNGLVSRYPIEKVFEYLALDFKETYPIPTDESNLSSDSNMFQLSEGDTKTCFYLWKNSDYITIVFKGVQFQVANAIYDGLDDKVNNIIEIIKLRSQINNIVEDTKKNLWNLFSDKKENSISEDIIKYQKISQIFQEMKKKGEKKESDIMLSFIDDIVTEINISEITSDAIENYLNDIKNGTISYVIRYYNSKIKKLLYKNSDSSLGELNKISVVCAKIYNNYPEKAEYHISAVGDMVKAYIIDMGGIDKINKDFLDILSDIFGKNSFYKMLLGLFIDNDISYKYNDNISLIDLSKYDLFSSNMWNDNNIPYFLHRVFIPYMTQLLLNDVPNRDLESFKDLDIEAILTRYNLDYDFVAYLKDYLLSNNTKFEEIYQTVLEKFIREDIDNISKRKLPNLMKYNVEFNIDNENISKESKVLFVSLLKNTIVFLLESNPSILEDREQYTLASLLELVGYDINIPFVEYIKYKAKTESKKELKHILGDLYSTWIGEDKNNIEKEIYFEKYIHVLNGENEERFVSELLLPFIQNRMERDSDILEDLENGNLENIAEVCGVKSDKFYDYIKYNLSQAIKSNVVETLILSMSKGLLAKDKNDVRKNRPIDYWKYESFFAIDNFADNIQEKFIKEILIPTLKFDIAENLQLLEGKDSLTFSGLLTGLGYKDFAFATYIKNNISAEEQKKYLNSLGENLIDAIISQHRNSNIDEKIQIIEKYKNLWPMLSIEVKKKFIDNFLDKTLRSQVDRDFKKIKSGKIGSLEYLMEDYNIYSFYMKDKYIWKYTKKLQEGLSNTHMSQLQDIHKTMLNAIKKGMEIDLEGTIQDYRRYTGISLVELEKKIDELENNYNSVFKQGENKLGVAYAKVYEKGKFTDENLKDLISKYKEYIDKYFVKNDVSKEENNILQMMMYTVVIYYFMVGKNNDFKYIMTFAKENSNYSGNYPQICNFLEDIDNLETSGMKKNMNYLLIMIKIYEKTFNQISISPIPTIEYIKLEGRKLTVKLENLNAVFQRGALYNVIEVLFLYKINNIYTSLTQTPYIGRMKDEPLTGDETKKLFNALSYKTPSYEELKIFRNRLSGIISSDNMKFMPVNSPLAISFKYVT